MNPVQGSRFRTIVIALLLFFGFASLVLGLNVSQVSHVPRDANAQTVVAAVPFAEMQEALQAQIRTPMRTPEEYAQAAQLWRDRATRMDAAVAVVRAQHPAVSKAWGRVRPSMITLGAPAPKSFSEVWPDGSMTASESAELYREEFAAAAAEANHGMTAFAAALKEAADGAAAATQARVKRLQYFNAIAMGTGLLLLAVLIFHVVRNLGTEERAISMAQRESAHILSTVNEGLFLLDQNLVIGAEHSAVLTQILRREQIAGLSFQDLLQDIVPGNTLTTALDFVGLLWSDRVEPELIDDINPLNEVEVHLDDGSGRRETRYLKFSFKRVTSADATANILGAVTDITEQVKLRAGLEEARAASEAQMDLMMSILHVPPDQLRSFLRDSEASLATVNTLLQEPAAQEADFRAKIDRIFRVVHGLKSDAAGLGLPTVEAKAHSFEDELQSIRAKDSVGGGDLLGLPIKLDDLLSHFGAIHSLVERLGALRSAFDVPSGQTMIQKALRIPDAELPAGLSEPEASAAVEAAAPEASAAAVEISAPFELPASADALAPAEVAATLEAEPPMPATVAPAAPRAADPIDATQPIMKVKVSAADAASVMTGPASVIAESASTLAARIGSDLSKDIRVITRGLEQLPSDLVTKTREVVLQLVRNAAVHGIEAPAHRTASGKHSQGTINIEVMADPQARTWELSVEDDGRGISRDRLRAAAVRKGMMTAEQAQALDGVKLIALLFKPGFTTAEEVTVHAGRGVGMDIVKSTVEELGGRIGVATKPGRFTRFKISLPMSVADEVAA
jgi:two-component system chemotaxis sensor kinase CheA